MAEELAPGYPDIPREELGELAGAVEQTQLDQKAQLDAWREFVRLYPSYANLALEFANRLEGSNISIRDAFLNGFELPFLLQRQQQQGREMAEWFKSSQQDAEPDQTIVTATTEIAHTPKRPRFWRIGAALIGLTYLMNRKSSE
jgi:hypothetical protein